MLSIRSGVVLSVVIAFCLGDPCSDLCVMDGPGICSKGSHTKGNGDCFGYVLRDTGDRCYHSTQSGNLCPATGKALTALEARKLCSREVPISVEGSRNGVWLQKGPVDLILPRMSPTQYVPVIRELISEGDKFLSQILTIERAISFPPVLVKEGLVSRFSDVNPYFELRCESGFFTMRLSEDQGLPDNWPDVLCSMLAVFRQQLELRSALSEWIRL
jgi:hypothetical protein